MLHRQKHLHETGQTCRFERMANICLDAPDRDLPAGRDMRREQRGEGAEFGRVADLRARGMGLDVIEP